jgi:hypothetical protein
MTVSVEIAEGQMNFHPVDYLVFFSNVLMPVLYFMNSFRDNGHNHCAALGGRRNLNDQF